MKRVLLTVGSGLVAGKRHSTQRALATSLARHADLWLTSIENYDWRKRRVRAYRRLAGGRYREAGWIAPAADLWVVYSDGYELDPRALGFLRRRDLFRAQIEFHRAAVESGAVGRVINPPEVEARTLKRWLATLDPARHRVIPTFSCRSLRQVFELRDAFGVIVAKLDWGGAGLRAQRLASPADVRRFGEGLTPEVDLDDYCFQPYRRGEEKRFWFVDGRCVAARVCRGRATPWSARGKDYAVRAYAPSTPGFAADLETAQSVRARAGLEVGSIDFIGGAVNEINGAGTIFTEYREWNRVVDARPALVRYIVDQARAD